MEPIKNNSHNLNITTINEVPAEVIPSFFLSLIPSYKAIRDTLAVCKKWTQLKITIYRKVEQEWPFVRRAEILHNLVFGRKSIVFTASENNLINAYMNEIPSMYSAKEFMSCWLKEKVKISSLFHEMYETQARKGTYALIEKSRQARVYLQALLDQAQLSSQKKTEFFTRYLLDNEEFEAAFAFSEKIDQLLRNQINQKIQSFFIEKRGYKEALKLTIAYNNPKSQILSYQVFFELGGPLFHQCRRSVETHLSDLLTHPFLEACRLLTPLPLSSVHLLLVAEMIIPVCVELKSEINESAEGSAQPMEIESPLLSHPLCNNPLIIDLFSLIPHDYNFGDGNIINQKIVETYLDYVDNSCPAMPHPDGQVLSGKEEKSFIQAIDMIPHSGLKKVILCNILDCFYMDIENNHLKMKAFWPCLYRLEARFSVKEGTATEALISLLVKNDSKDFIREIKEPSTGLEKFPQLVKALFEKFPGFLNSLKLPPYELLNIYEAIFKLFIGQYHMIRLIKDCIENEYVKAQLKLSKT